MTKDFERSFVAFAYEDVCKDIFAKLCREGEVGFAPSWIGSYWLNDLESDTEIDVMAVDHQNKRLFAGERKYHAKPVDAPVYFALREKVEKSQQIAKAFPGYEVLYGIFSKSGFTTRLRDVAKDSSNLLLIDEDRLAED